MFSLILPVLVGMILLRTVSIRGNIPIFIPLPGLFTTLTSNPILSATRSAQLPMPMSLLTLIIHRRAVVKQHAGVTQTQEAPSVIFWIVP